MAQKKKGAITKKKASLRKPARKKQQKKKALKKKVLKKKVSKVARRGKKASKKKTAPKKAVKRTGARKPSTKAMPAEGYLVEPGPPPISIPPVEEPASSEEAVGVVTHYYSHLGVAVVQINKGALRTGSRILVKGHTTDFTQTVESMEYEHQHTDEATAGQSVGLKVTDHAREHDIVYLVK